MLWLKRPLSLVFVLALLPYLHAAEPSVARAPSREPVPYRYDAAKWKQVPAEFLDDAAACILYTATAHLLDEDGATETIVHDITRLNTRKGIEDLGEYRYIVYDPSHEKLTLNEARIHKANGKIVPIEPRSMQIRDVATDFLVYDQAKRLILSFPNLEVGDVYEVKWTVKGKHPEYQGKFFQRYNLGSDKYPTVADELFVQLPTKMAFSHAVTGPLADTIQPKVTHKNTQSLYHWAGANLKQFPRDEDLPSKDLLRSEVVCSTFKTWDEVYQWEKHLLRNCWECTADIKKVVAEVTKGLTDPRDKARALTYWVRRNIRYVSMGETHDYTPHAPATVLANRHGDCKDGSQLLAVMLREIGLKPYLVTLCTRDHGQIVEAVPSPWGSHAIVMVPIEGKEHWIDTTSPLNGWDFLPTGDRKRVCYLTNDKELRLTRTPALTPAENRVDTTTRLTIAPDGSSRGRRSYLFHGLAGMLQRDKFHEENWNERRRLMAHRLQDSNSRIRLIDFRLDEAALANFDGPVKAEVEYVTPEHFVGDKELDGSVSDSYVWTYLLGYTLDYDRKAPLELFEPFESKHTYIVEAPAGFEFLGVPTKKSFKSRWGSFERSGKFLDTQYRTVQIDFTVRIDETIVEPKDFVEFRRFHDSVHDFYRGYLTLEKIGANKDIGELEALLQLAPGEPQHALSLARIYQKDKKPAEAQRVLKHALYYLPDDEKLWEELVKLVLNRDEEEQQLRTLVKTFPGEPKHAIALGAALIERGKHAEAQQLLKVAAEAKDEKKQAQANYQLARNAFAQKQYALARLYLNLAFLQDAKAMDSVEANVLRARANEQLNDVPEALKFYQAALKVAKDDQMGEPLVGIIRVGLVGNKRDEALAGLRRYLTLVDRDLGRLVIVGEAAMKLDRLDDALELAGRVREAGAPQLSERLSGLVWLQRGQSDKAVEHLSKAVSTKDVLAGLLQAQLALGDLAGVEKTVARINDLAVLPDTLRQQKELAQKLLERRTVILQQLPAEQRDKATRAVGRLVCAEEALRLGKPLFEIEKLLQETPEVGEAVALRALLLLRQGKLARALTEAEKAVKLSPKEPRGWYVLGRVRLERGKDTALADLTRAVELSRKKDAEYLQGLAEAQYQAGQKEAAIQSLRGALELRDDKEWQQQLKQWQEGTSSGASEGAVQTNK